MTWKWIAGVALTAGVAVGLALTARVNRTEAVAAAPAKKAAAEKPKRATKAETAAELTAIVRETKSPETFMVALTALIALDPKDRSALPLAIRKADELGILKNAMQDNPQSPVQESFLSLVELLLGDSIKDVGTKHRSCTTPSYSPAPQCPPGCAPSAETLPATFTPPAPFCPPATSPVQRRTMPTAQDSL